MFFKTDRGHEAADNGDRQSKQEVSFDTHDLYKGLQGFSQSQSKESLRIENDQMHFNALSGNPLDDVLKDIHALSAKQPLSASDPRSNETHSTNAALDARHGNSQGHHIVDQGKHTEHHGTEHHNNGHRSNEHHGNEHHGNEHHGNAHHGNEHYGNEHHGNAHHGNEHHGNAHHSNEHHGNAHHGNEHHGNAHHGNAHHGGEHGHKPHHPNRHPHPHDGHHGQPPQPVPPEPPTPPEPPQPVNPNAEPSVLDAANGALSERSATGQGNAVVDSVNGNITYSDGSTIQIQKDNDGFVNQLIQTSADGTTAQWTNRGYDSNGFQMWDVSTKAPGPTIPTLTHLDADLTLTGDGTVKILNTSGEQTVLRTDGSISIDQRNLAQSNQQLQITPGADQKSIGEVQQTVDNLPESTLQAVQQSGYPIKIIPSPPQNGAAAYVNFGTKEIDIFTEPNEIYNGLATAHEAFHTQDYLDNIAGNFSANPDPTALAIANQDLANMTPAQLQQLQTLKPNFGLEQNAGVLTDKNGNTYGFGDLTADIAGGYIDGNDCNGIGEAAAALFPQLTQYLKGRIEQ